MNNSFISLVKNKLPVIVLFIIIFPLVAISFFNHPSGDDYWFSALVRNNGFFIAYEKMYNSVSPRYTALTIMGINPLVFGNFSVYRIIPILYIILLFLSIRFVLTAVAASVNMGTLSKKNITVVAAAAVITYFAIMPGIGEGIYWTSSLVVYQFGILFFLLWAGSLVRVLGHPRSVYFQSVFCCIAFISAAGCNEIIAAVMAILNMGITVYYLSRYNRVRFITVILFILSLVFWYYLLRSPSFHFRYIEQAASGSNDWTFLFIRAIAYTGYHVFKCLVNPFFWIGILIIGEHLPSTDYLKRSIPKILRSKYVTLVLILAMISIEFIGLVLTPNHVVPLRITNISIFIFLAASLFYGYIFSDIIKSSFLYRFCQKYQSAFILILLLAGLATKNNISTAYAELLTGEARSYDKELKNRYYIINTCASDTCMIPELIHRPATLRYSSNDNDEHIGEYFNKKIIYTR